MYDPREEGEMELLGRLADEADERGKDWIEIPLADYARLRLWQYDYFERNFLRYDFPIRFYRLKPIEDHPGDMLKLMSELR